MADVAVLGIRLENGQAVVAARETGTELESMGAKGEAAGAKVEAAFRRQAVAARQAEAAARSMGLKQIEAIAIDAKMAQTALGAAEAAEHHSLSLGRISKSFEHFSARALGANEQVALLAAAMAHLEFGEIAVVAALAGVFAGIEVWRAWHEETSKAKAEQDKLTESLEKWYAKEREGKAGAFPAMIAAETAKVKELRQSLDELADGQWLAKLNAIGEGGSKWMAWLRISSLYAKAVGQALTGNLTGFKDVWDQLNTEIAKGGAAMQKAVDTGDAALKAAAKERDRLLNEQAKKVREANEDMIREAQQRIVLAGLEGEALKKQAVAFDAVNKAIKARRELEDSPRLLKETTDAIAAEEQLNLAAIETAFSMKATKDMIDGLTGAIKKMADGLARALGPLKGFVQLLAELVARQAATSMAGFIGTAAIEGGAAETGAGGSVVGGIKAAASAAGGAIMAHPYIAAGVAMVAVTAALFGMRQSASDAAKALAAMVLAQTQVAASLATWRASITGTAADQKAAALLELKLKYLGIEADIQRLEGGKKMEAQREKDLAEAATLYGMALKKSADSVTGAFSTMVNMVSGYKLQSTIFGASTARSGGSSPSSGGTTIVVMLPNGTVLGKTVLTAFKETAQRQFGDSTRWQEIQ